MVLHGLGNERSSCQGEDMSKKRFKFKVTYFKPSGKYYTHNEFYLEADDVSSLGDPPVAYMQDAVDYLKALRDWQDNIVPLPGLASRHWDGYMVVDCDEGHPALILPDK